MDLISSHNNLDFDGLAAMIGAYKLYPDSKLLLPEQISNNVKAFLALYKDTFPFIEKITFDPGSINNLIIVDTRDINRLSFVKEIIEKANNLILFDHHPHFDLDRAPTYQVVDTVGATCTLITEEIKEKNIELSSLEAGILALGIYADTGIMTFDTTTYRDIEAVGYLLRCGADLKLIREYVTDTLEKEQRDLLEELLINTENYNINDYKIGISIAQREEFIAGLAILIHKLMEIENVDMFFIIVNLKNKIHIVSRSRRKELNVRRVIEHFDGKGHDQAASATIDNHGTDIKEIKGRIIELLNWHLPVHINAETIMSKPVKTISMDITVEEAGKTMMRYGHSGLPIVNDENENKLVGVISRRDVEKAQHHGLGHAPVKGYMSQKVVTITPETPLREIQHLLVNKNVGRLPVLNSAGRLVGIVTRSDLLRIQHGLSEKAEEKENLYLKEVDEEKEDIKELINERLPERVVGLLYLIGQKAEKEGYKVYGVGGFVRDLLLGKNNIDLDLVVEKDAISLSKILANYLNGELKTFPQFQTATLTLPQGLRIDFATARIEFYAFPAAAPEVEKSTIKQDLYRRDFTINTMAVELNISSFGKLLDFFNGREDLKKRHIRVLYNLSFVEDPTRIFRAIRFETRLGFIIEEQTLLFIKNAVETGVIEKLPGEKLHEELRLVFHEPNYPEAIRRIDNLGILNNIFPGVRLDDKKVKMLYNVEDVIKWYNSKRKNFSYSISKEAVVFSVLFFGQSFSLIDSYFERIKIAKKVREVIFETLKKTPEISNKLKQKDIKNSELAEIMEGLPLETVLYILAENDSFQIRENIYHYMDELQGIGIEITGEDLKSLGIEPGPIYKEVLEQVRKARLDGLVNSVDEEIEFVMDFFSKKGEAKNG
ncbi:CBS domain-containing protein [Natranaerofaba carboxydovora]|uniref:CBS domain-containing protein n=1 Tax=Natranaerofaba carboxydovora TaxID=2742683 RepID=UPI001F13F5B2|nr:CBS domain-containing protein [Natranaerofaba carboxydovora]UMZ73910.1 Multifunctional CCA protein [Natranaerofaba carboxydovora]